MLSLLTPQSAHLILLCVIKYYNQITHKMVLYRLQVTGFSFAGAYMQRNRYMPTNAYYQLEL